MSEPTDGPWALTLQQAGARRRALDLLSDDHAEQRIQSLTEVEAYYAIKEIGLDDAGPVLALLERHQIRAILDLESWHQQQLEISDLLIWLAAFREAKPEQVVAAARALDVETLSLLFRRRLLVALKPAEDEEPEDAVPDWVGNPPEEILPLVETPDRRFVVAARVVDEVDEGESERPIDEEERKSILELVEELYKDEDWEYVAGALRLASTDLSSNLEEEALRFRNARVEDLGFPPYERALEIYALLDPAVLRRAPTPLRSPILEEQLPAFYVAPIAGGLFDQAMASLTDDTLVRRIEGDLVPAANAILVADGREPGDLEGLERSLRALRGYLEIGLGYEAPAAQAVETAARRLASFHVVELFRVGYTLTVRLAERARKLGARLRLDGPELAVVDGLSKRRPRYAPVLDPIARALDRGESLTAAGQGGLDEGQLVTPLRAFHGPNELAAATWVVEGLEALAEALGPGLAPEAETGIVVPPPAERTTQILIATATARALLGQPFRPVPLDAEALLDLADRVGPSEPAALAHEVERRLQGQPKVLVERAQSSAEALRQALRPLVGASEIDPRFVGIVLCRLG